MPKRNKHYARYIFLKMRPIAGESTVTYATRLREKAQECDFKDSCDDRILEHLIQTIENEALIQKCISKGWSLCQFLTEAGQIEDISLQMQDMKASPWEKQIAMVNSYKKSRRNVTNKYQNLSDIMAQPCAYCGLSGMHPKGIDCPAYGRRCNICFKLNHFPTVCRTKMGHSSTREKPHTHESNPKLMKTVVQNDESDASSDDDFLVQATEHMRIKKVDRITNDDTHLSDNIKSLETRIRRLEKDFNEAKNSQYSDSQETNTEISAFDGFDRETEMHKVNKQRKSIETTLCNLESVDDIDIYPTPAEIREIFQYQQRNLKDLESKKSFTKVQRDKVLADQKKIYPQKETKEKNSDATRNTVATQYQLKANLEVSRKLHAQLDKEFRQNERQKE